MISRLHILRYSFFALVFLLLNGFTNIESINIDSRFAIINKGFLDGYVPGKWVCFNNSNQVCGRIFSSRKRWSYVYVKPHVLPLIELEARANLVGGESRAARVVQRTRGSGFVIDQGINGGFYENQSVCFYRQTRLGCGTVTKSLGGSASVQLRKGNPASIEAGDYVVLEGSQSAFRLDNHPRIIAIRQTEGKKVQVGSVTCFTSGGRDVCGESIFQEPDGAVIQIERSPVDNKVKKYPVPPPPTGRRSGEEEEYDSGSRYEWVFKSGVEGRFFHESPTNPGEPTSDYSAFVQPRLSHFADNDRRVISAEFFYRKDTVDPSRTHFDVRELSYVNSYEHFDVRLGISKVFWGVAESVNLVDIVNQTDLVEDPDGDEKLGQAMANLTWVTDYGSLSLFALPFFRERNLPSYKSRFGNFPGIDFTNAANQGANEGRTVDLAARYSVNYDLLDLGLTYFNGTDREPMLFPEFSPEGQVIGASVIYPLLQQIGMDAQLSFESIALKAETVFKQYGHMDYLAAVGGIEKPFANIFDWGWDITLFAEYLYDDRQEDKTVLFQNDTFVGLQFNFYDTQNTKFVLGGIVDNEDTGSYLGKVELSRRIGEKYEAVLETQIYHSDEETSPLFALTNDSFTRLGLNLYF
ncbi:MAG: hypothetical protein AB7T49_06280 [Oligoflexales bacterium]